LREAAQSAAKFVRAPGNFLFTLAVACALLLWHRARWRAAVLLAISGALSGVAVHILKWSVGRQRPAVGVEHAHTINPFAGGLEGLINQKNLSFPSGDTALAFATAACLGLWFGRWRLAFFAWAAIVGAQRILTNSHYPSEVLAAAGLGVVCVPAARWLYRRLFGAVPN
jgi:undecaprenyl-diphosphatase